MAERDVKVMHCPGSNLKLGSGIAPVVEMRRARHLVSLGADGAACNNRLDMFDEMRLAATLQAVRLGPGALPARDVLWMATREGARALGLEGEIGFDRAGQAGRPHPRGSRSRAPRAGRRPVVDAGLRRPRHRCTDDDGRRRDAGRRLQRSTRLDGSAIAAEATAAPRGRSPSGPASERYRQTLL